MVKGISTFIRDISNRIKKGDGKSLIDPSILVSKSFTAIDVLVQYAPALHGLYRAISSTPYPWTTSQWSTISEELTNVCQVEAVDRLNSVLVEIAHQQDPDVESHIFVQTFLARYVSRGRPLSGYFIVCCILETNWTILAQVLTAPHDIDYHRISEASAANNSWNALMLKEALEIDIEDEKIVKGLRTTILYAMQCFTDLLFQVEDMDSEPPVDTYVWETMSESLVSRDGSYQSSQTDTVLLETRWNMLRDTSRTE